MTNSKTAVGKRGFYIVGEGNDGTGKSTQIELLAKYIEKEFGLEVLVINEPGGTPIAEEIRHIIKNGSLERSAVTNLLLFTVCRYEVWFKEALPVLSRGGVVLSARNYLSSVVYQGLAEGLGSDYVRQVTAAFMDRRYMEPDLTVILSLEDDTRRTRLNQRGAAKNPDTFEIRDDDFQEKINQGYAGLVESDGFCRSRCQPNHRASTAKFAQGGCEGDDRKRAKLVDASRVCGYAL